MSEYQCSVGTQRVVAGDRVSGCRCHPRVWGRGELCSGSRLNGTCTCRFAGGELRVRLSDLATSCPPGFEIFSGATAGGAIGGLLLAHSLGAAEVLDDNEPLTRRGRHLMAIAADLVLLPGQTSQRGGPNVSGSTARRPRVDLKLPLADLRQHQEITADTAALKAAIVAVIATLPEWQRAAALTRMDALASGTHPQNGRPCESPHQMNALRELVQIVKRSVAAYPRA
jgi:hypothetical protein